MTKDNLHTLLKSLGFRYVVTRGHNLMACCPNHSERRPSWGVSVNPPHFHGCFACDYKGTLGMLLKDKFNYTDEKIKNLGLDTLDNRELRDLHFGGTYTGPKDLPEVDEQELWPFAMEPKGRRYANGRGITDETIKHCNLLYHRLDNRLLFPWYVNAKLVGMTGRACYDTDEGDKIKAYCGLVKGKCLYIPDRGYLDPKRELILVEGEIDALKVYQAGFDNVAALGHGRFATGQIAFLKNLPVKNLLLAFDNDRRGEELTEIVKSEMGRCRVVDWSRFGLKDPGAMSDKALRRLIKAARGSISFPSFSS